MTPRPTADPSPRPARAQTAAALCFLAPNFLGFLIFTAGPVLFSLVVSFSNWNLQKTEPFGWIGLENFRELLTDDRFWLYFLNTLYLMIGIPFAIAGSLFVAVLMNQKLRGIIAYRTLFYLPSFTSGVALMILWKALYNPDFGPINAALGSVAHLFGLGHAELPRWLGSMQNLFGLDPEQAKFTAKFFGLGARDAIIFMGVWTAIGGNNMLLYLASLSNVPPELTEAAQLDGAGKWQVFRHVTWPQLAPTTFFIVIMSMIGGLQGGFEQARIMTGGGPAGTTTTLSYYIYNKAFTEFQIGYASAVSWILFVMIFAFTLIYWKVGSKELSY
jgi:multiple sugar transport system permease protein